jgi:hypothetical protein
VRRPTRFFLLAGCAWIVTLAAPAALAAFVAGWRGPYPGRAVDTRTVEAIPARARAPAAAQHGRLELARR